jgi:hypothetical protein
MKLSNILHDIMMAFNAFELNQDSFSLGQLQSKEWLVDNMNVLASKDNIHYGNIFNLCGWYGLLPMMMWSKNVPYHTIKSFDVDESCKEIADKLNWEAIQDGKFKSFTKDIYDIDYSIPDTIINTACEHLQLHWFDKIPKGKTVILQSNDYFLGTGHINCMVSEDDFEDSYHLTNVLFKGTIKLQKYKRFMLIGVK